MFKKRTTAADVVGMARKAAGETDDPELKERYEVIADAAEHGIVPPHIKGSAFAPKGLFTRRQTGS